VAPSEVVNHQGPWHQERAASVCVFREECSSLFIELVNYKLAVLLDTQDGHVYLGLLSVTPK